MAIQAFIGLVGLVVFIAALVGGYIALMIWDWRKKRALGRTETPPKPSAEEIKAAREGAKTGDCPTIIENCQTCPAKKACYEQHEMPWDGADNSDEARMPRKAAWFRAWLTERGIPLEEPKDKEAH